MMLTLVRHGRTAANARGLLLGRADPPLDGEGMRQAEAVAAALTARSGRVERVICSPLSRCRATADVLAASLGVAVEVDARWVELDYGDLDGVPVASLDAAFWASWRSDVTWRPPGGEALSELGTRVRAACSELVADATTGEVVVVSHVSPIKAAVAWALGVGDEAAWRMFLAPASTTRIAFRAGTPSLHAFNEPAPAG